MKDQRNPDEESPEDDCIARAREQAATRIEAIEEAQSIVPQQRSASGAPTKIVAPNLPSVSIPGFEIHRRLGAGGAAHVYEANQIQPPRRVAIKILRPFLVNEELVRRFDLEARLLAKLKHPGIVSVHEAGLCDFGGHPTPFIVMELVEGVPINQYCDQSSLGWREKTRILVNVCDAVRHAHQKGVVHRDLKPDNILVDSRSKPYVLDFGVAAIVGPDKEESTMHTQAGQWLGTLPYMSPEQISAAGDDVDTRSDIYAIGIVGYEVFAGSPPFPGDNPARLNIADRICNETPVPLGKLTPECRGDLETIIGKALQKDAEQRYDTVAELAADLNRVLNGEPILARRTPVLGRFARWCRRQRAVASLAAALLIAFVLLLLSIAQSWRKTRMFAEQRRAGLYAAEMNLAFQAIEDNDVGTVRRLLLRQIPKAGESDQRRFEWRYLWRLVHAEQQVLQGHSGPVYDIAISPDGKTMASCGLGDWILWDTATWTPRIHRHRAGKFMLSVAFSPDSQRLAIGCRESDCEVIRVSDGAIEQTLPATHQVLAVNFSPDGNTLAIGSGWYDPHYPLTHPGSLSLWDSRSGKPLWNSSEPITSVTSLKFLDSGRRLLTGHGTEPARMWDLNAAIHDSEDAVDSSLSVSIAMEVASTSPVIATNGDETLVAIGALKHQTRLWNLDDQSEGPVIPIDQVSDVQISPDSRRLLTVSRRGYPAQLWDIQTGRLLDELHGHEGDLFAAAYVHNGAFIATAGEDRLIRIWDAKRQHSARTIPVGDFEIASMVISRSQRWLVTGDRGGAARIWDTKTWQCVYSAVKDIEFVEAVALSPDENTMAIATRLAPLGSCIKLVSWQQQVDPLQLCSEKDLITGLAYSPCGKYLACATIGAMPKPLASAAVRLWRTDDWALIWESNKSIPGAQAVEFSPDSSELSSGHVDGKVRRWNVAEGQMLQTSSSFKGAVTEVKYSHGGKMLGIGTWPHWDLGRPGPEVRVIDATTLATRHIMRGHKGGVYGVGFSPDDRTLASGGGGGLVKLWDVKSGLQRAEIATPKTGWVFNAEFNEKGDKLIATYGSSTDSSGIVVWNAESDGGKKHASFRMIDPE